MNNNNKPQESVADFRARIAAMKRSEDGHGVYSLVGGPRANKAVLRDGKDAMKEEQMGKPKRMAVRVYEVEHQGDEGDSLEFRVVPEEGSIWK